MSKIKTLEHFIEVQREVLDAFKPVTDKEWSIHYTILDLAETIQAELTRNSKATKKSK